MEQMDRQNSHAIVASLGQEADQSWWICSHRSCLVWVDFWFFCFECDFS